MYHRDETRWKTRFGSWVGQVTVAAIVSELAGDPRTRVTPNAVYQWLAGHVPDYPRARALVDYSEGAITYDVIYSHADELEAAREEAST